MRPPFVLLALAVPIFAGCDDSLPGKPKPADRFERPESVLSFAALFRDNCAACHGAAGDLGPGPPLKDDLFRALVSTAELEDILTQGRPGTLMPAFALRNGGTLTDTQIQVLVHEIKGVPYRLENAGIDAVRLVADAAGAKPLWGASKPVSDAPPLVGKASAGDWQAGLAVWKTACAGCHGPNGQGVPAAGSPTLAIHDPAFLALSSDRVLRRFILTGRPDLGMPDFRGAAGRGPDFAPLTNQQVTDLTALLAHWRASDQ